MYMYIFYAEITWKVEGERLLHCTACLGGRDPTQPVLLKWTCIDAVEFSIGRVASSAGFIFFFGWGIGVGEA